VPKHKTQQSRGFTALASHGNARKAATDFRQTPAKRQLPGSGNPTLRPFGVKF